MIIVNNILLIENKLIQNGIKNLKEFGYPLVNEKNILTDIIYSKFFSSMLNQCKKKAKNKKDIITACNSLINKIEVTA
jgi:hypothetical protein